MHEQCRRYKKISLTRTFISLSTVECGGGGQFGIISAAAAMAGLTHGAVALPVITGQRSEATPYPTIHKGSHTIHNTCTLYPTPHDTMQQNPGIGATSSGQAGHVGPFQVMVPHSDHQPPLGYWLKVCNIRCSGAALLPRACIFKFAPIFCRMLQERACKCIWVKDRLDFFNPLEIQMFNYFPFPKLKVTIILFLLLY